jgi:hypothetical protein
MTAGGRPTVTAIWVAEQSWQRAGRGATVKVSVRGRRNRRRVAHVGGYRPCQRGGGAAPSGPAAARCGDRAGPPGRPHQVGLRRPPLPGRLRRLAVPVHSHRPVPRTATDRVRTDRDPHLPHPRTSLPQRPATTRISHERNRTNHDRPADRRHQGSTVALNGTVDGMRSCTKITPNSRNCCGATDLGSAPGGIRTPNLLIRRVMHVRY